MDKSNAELKKLNEIQQELIETAISGGMMGGFNEEGFPFYYINQKMLQYLGYEDQDSFIADTDGMISNCMHPEDRAFVDQECEKQFALGDSYQLEYRMRKKDGTYIWVHDIGKKFKTVDGRDAIMSLCYDITEEKEQQKFIYNFVDSINGSMGNYLVDEDGVLTATYMSGNIGNMLGFNKEQYLVICQKDAINCIYPADRDKVKNSILETVHKNKSTSISFRAINSEGGYTWLNGSYSKCGEIDGKSNIRVVFTPVTDQFSLQQDIIHNVPGGVCLYKWDGTEIRPLVFSNQFVKLYGGDGTSEDKKISGVNYEYVYEEDLPGYQAFVQQIITEPGKERNYTFRFWNLKQKKYVWISVNTFDVVQDDGSILIYANYYDVDQIKEAEVQIKRNEEMLEATCSFAGVWTFVYDIEKKTVYPGKTLQDAFGLKAEEEDFPECMLKTGFIPEESKEIYRVMTYKIDQGYQGFKTDILVYYSEGEKHWLRYEWKIIEYQNGLPKIALGYARCVDEEKLLEARITMEQERLLGGDGILLAYIVSNISLNHIIEHKTFLQETPLANIGMGIEEGAGKNASFIVDAGKREEFLQHHKRKYLIEQYNSGVSSISSEYQRKRPDGSLMWEKNIMNVLLDPESGELYLYEYCYDVNKEKMLEEITLAAIHYDYERFGSINLKENQISILVPDTEKNRYQLHTENYTDLCKKYALEHVYEEDREMFLQNVLPESLSKKLDEQRSFEFSHREISQDGEIRYKQNRHAYYDQERKICLLTRSDITEMVKEEEEKQKRLQIALQKEKDAAKVKSNFLSRMSHELRTPLNAIVGYATLVKENVIAGKAEHEEDLEHLDAIQKATNYLLAIIGDLLDTQRIEAGKMQLTKEVTNPQEYMQNIVEMIQPEADLKEIQFSYERLTETNAFYLLDGVRLQQVLLNLLHNAIKFTPRGGSVNMTAEMVHQEGTKAFLQFKVSDTGVGMSKEFMDNHLYQTFSQENSDMTSPYAGTGIGLAISKELVQLMEGDITCESKKGEGTTFTVTIAADAVEATRRRRREHSKENYDLGGIHILLCEDNPMNQDMTKRLLNKMNCEVEVADDGKIGAKIFEESEQGYFNLVLMDLRMPIMDGFEATRTIRSLPRGDAKTLPILALSANAFDEDIQMSLDSGMNEHLAKPVDARILYQKILEYCKRAE